MRVSVLEQKRGPRAWALRRALEERGSRVTPEKRRSKPRILYLHGRGSRVLERKRGPRVWALRRAFEERGSRVASKKRESEPRVLYLQSKLQLQNLQFFVDGCDAFTNV